MQFSDTINKTGLVEDCSFVLFGDSGDHTADYPLADLARNINNWYDKVVTAIFKADSMWEWDDSNATDLPIANIDLANGQQDYGVSGLTFLKITRVDVKDSNGNGINLLPVYPGMLRGIALSEYYKVAGIPKVYYPKASSLFLYPAPNYNYTKGLRIFYQRNVSYFVATDTTKVPGFAATYHRILSLGGAYEYALVNGMDDKMALINRELYGDGRTKVGLFDELINFYSARNVDQKRSLHLQKSDYGELTLGQGSGNRQSNLQNPKGFF